MDLKDVFHKAVFHLDEKGTVAAAVTAVGMEMESIKPPSVFAAEELIRAVKDSALEDKDLLPQIDRYLAMRADINADDGSEQKHTALLYACAFCGREVVDMLLENGAKVNLSNAEGFTPLMLAVRSAKEGVLEAVLNAGGDPRQTNKDGLCALDFIVTQDVKDKVNNVMTAHTQQALEREAQAARMELTRRVTTLKPLKLAVKQAEISA